MSNLKQWFLPAMHNQNISVTAANVTFRLFSCGPLGNQNLKLNAHSLSCVFLMISTVTG